MVRTFCVACHDADDPEGGLDLGKILSQPVATNRREWELVVRRLRAGQMPPLGEERPPEVANRQTLNSLTSTLDDVSQIRPYVGRVASLRRLTRVEYQNAIRDLLSFEVDAARLLPKDDVSHGFDNVTVGELSPTLLNRYVSSAQKISRSAVGRNAPGGEFRTIRIRPDLTQERHLPNLPLGTRGGTTIPLQLGSDGEYEIRVRLARDRNEHVEGLRGRHTLEVLVDRRPMKTFVVQPPKNRQGHSQVDAHLVARVPIKAGRRQLAITFVPRAASLLETKRQPYQARFNMHRHPRTSPAVYQVSIAGPFGKMTRGEVPSRQRVFFCQPNSPGDEEACAQRILANLARSAWRRPVSDDDLKTAMRFFRQARPGGGFEQGVESALGSLLVNPQFLFRIERQPPGVRPGENYRISDVELASRLSFFIWSSIPDDELLRLAEQGKLREPETLRQQVRRMLADSRSQSLVTNFVAQWLYLRNLESIQPDMRQFPDFDHNLRGAMRRETELFFTSVVREDRSVLDLLRADYTYLNERLAKHYGIPHVYGSRFRRVPLGENSQRGGLLRQASILTVTSYATRTSPVIRGQWILKNLMGTPSPPPPDDVPALKEDVISSRLPVRQRLAQHRRDPVCARCHNMMDPIGFSLEQYDAIGRWRTLDAGHPVDATGALPDGTKFKGAAGLENGLLKRPELFVGTLTEKLMTFALGRGVDHNDAPAVRAVLRRAKKDKYRFSTIVLGIVESAPFLMRTAE